MAEEWTKLACPPDASHYVHEGVRYDAHNGRVDVPTKDIPAFLRMGCWQQEVETSKQKPAKQTDEK